VATELWVESHELATPGKRLTWHLSHFHLKASQCHFAGKPLAGTNSQSNAGDLNRDTRALTFQIVCQGATRWGSRRTGAEKEKCLVLVWWARAPALRMFPRAEGGRRGRLQAWGTGRLLERGCAGGLWCRELFWRCVLI
jgi:hypothetical protein